LIDFGLQRKLYNSVQGFHHHFQISEMKIYKTYEGHITHFCCFKAQRASRKTGIESDPNFLHSKCCLGLWLISQVLEVHKFQDQCRWKEDSIFYNFSRNRDLWIRTFPTSNLARNIRIGKEYETEKEIFFFPSRGKKARI
jgi:hypothetical protein